MSATVSPVGLIETHFGHLRDPRAVHSILHKLIDILIITICAVISGADDFVVIAIKPKNIAAGVARRNIFGFYMESFISCKSLSSLDGEIRPKENACKNAGIPIEDVQFTIQKLGLNVQRLKE
jgi:hypothetical protein